MYVFELLYAITNKFIDIYLCDIINGLIVCVKGVNKHYSTNVFF